MDYKTNIEFLDWLMWDKEVNEKEGLEAIEIPVNITFNFNTKEVKTTAYQN